MGVFSVADMIVFVGLLLAVMAVGLWSGRKEDTTEDYFLAGRNMGWFVIGASIFASNIGSEHVVGLAGTGAESGAGAQGRQYQSVPG